MVELDTLVLNIDRHFNNFGIMFDHVQNCYVPALLFDQGLSLTVGAGIFGSFSHMMDLRKVRMLPFASRVSKNRGALPSFRFEFDALKFVHLLFETSMLPKEALRVSNQFIALRRRLVTYYKVDSKGIDINELLTSYGL